MTNERSLNQSASDYHPLPLEASAALEASAPLEVSASLEEPRPAKAYVIVERIQEEEPIQNIEQTQVAAAPVSVASPTVAAQAVQHSEAISEETIQILEERLVIDQRKRKVGEVIFRKQVETQIVEVPIRREKIIVEQISPEHKQLAVIDLTQGDLDRLKLLEVNDLASHSTVNEATDFISIQKANRILTDIFSQPNVGSQNARVKIIFEDSSLQQSYQQRINSIE